MVAPNGWVRFSGAAAKLPVMGGPRCEYGHQVRRPAEQLPGSQIVHLRAGIRSQLDPLFSFKAQGNSAVGLAAQVHDQPVPMGYGMGIPMDALQGLGIKQSVASAQVE